MPPRSRWTSSLPWTVEIRGGISELHADLRELQVDAIDITGGASDLSVTEE